MDEVARMMAGTAAALPIVFTLSNMTYCLTGLVFGIAWGAVPALTSTMAMALLMGFSAGMSLEGAIILLLGVYSGSVFGGSISAVCINIPGKPNSVCTAIEGYPLFRRGEGGTALGTAIIASSVGNVFGTVVLIICTPFVLALALGIGAWEVFLLGLWGVLFSGSITDAPPLKGWLAGLIGLSIAFVGADSISGEIRYTFGIPALYGGVSFVSVLIGLFGFTEIARGLLFEADYKSASLNRIRISWRQLRDNLATLFNGSAIGTFVGALPAAGADVAAFLSYTVSRRLASPKQRAEYGKGSYRGIIAAETADNASVGGDLLPTLVLAIPGSTVAAAFMGALNLQGVVVGPMIEMSHPGLLEYVFASLLIVSLLLGIVGYLVAKPAIALLSVPRNVLLPSIMPICVMGAFAAQNNVVDIYIMLISGVAGISLVMAGIPVAPICIGLILGPLVDLNLRRALLIYQDQDLSVLLTRPIGLVLIAVIAITVVGSMKAGKDPGATSQANP
jgi:putative tricarboxylic transport membrane protein